MIKTISAILIGLLTIQASASPLLMDVVDNRIVKITADSLLPVDPAYQRHKQEPASDQLSRKASYRFFSRLAAISIRLKMYPLAMRCYYKALENSRPRRFAGYQFPVFLYPVSFSRERTDPSKVADSNTLRDPGEPGSTDSLSFNRLFAAGNTDYKGKDLKIRVTESPLVNIADVRGAFEDGKPAKAYALIVHVKQPVPGRRKAFTHINNVGHTFVTLIKYNEDNSVVSRSFGFYPLKSRFLAGTPFHPRSAATFKDDADHDWDEMVGKFISSRRFYRIIALLNKYKDLQYNLNQNNCTDFGLRVATLGGIGISETRGRWPFGQGNNPANAGQSVREGKFFCTDEDYSEPLFADCK